LNKFISEAFWL